MMTKIKGLTSSEVKSLTLAGKTNKLKNNSSRSVKDILRSNIFTFFNLLHILLFAALLLVGAYRNMLFIFIIVINSAIGTIQELRAKKVIDRLSVLVSPNTVTAIRDYKQQTVSTEDLVEGDIVIFEQGTQICADCTVIDGYAEVNESLLTGESEPVIKQEGSTLLSGSFISSGKVLAKLEKVGAESYAANLTSHAKEYKKINSEILNALNKIIKVIGFVIIPIGLILFTKDYFLLEQTISGAVSAVVALLIGMIPEGLYLLTSIALAVSVIRLGRKNTLVREMYAIEQLARVDVLCIDKTGTITSGNMQITDFECFSDEYDVAKIMANMNSALSGNTPTQNALDKYFGKDSGFLLKKAIPFSSQRKWQACIFEEGCFVCGAPEFILDNIDGMEKYTGDGKRVLALAKCELSGDVINSAEKIAYIIIEDELRPNAAETFKFFAENNVDIKVISGDNPETVKVTAQKAGIKNAENYIDMSVVSDENIPDICDEFNVFGRVSPSQKELLVKALKNKNHIVAMVGDGVNDVLALKNSDCSIAMAQGSDAARRVATLVLTTSDFSSMPGIVAEGRRVINNIQRTASLFLVKTIFSTILSVLLLFLPMSYPLEPIQITLFGSTTIGIPAFLLALRSNKSKINGNFLKNIIMKAFPSGICDVCGIMAILVYNAMFPLPENVLGTMTTYFITFIGFLTLFKVCIPFDKRNIAMFSVLLGIFLLCITVFKEIFFIVHIPLIPFIFLIALMVASIFIWLFISNILQENIKK